MTLNFTSSWSPPPNISDLEFSNCTAGSIYFATIITNEETSDLGYEATFNLLYSLLPPNWARPTKAELMVWQQSWDAYTREYVVNTTADMVEFDCDREICRYLPLEGDPDLAGLGVSTEA